ncbi:MAG: biotin--[Clostridia bacterium]|nr:biotin--[acetyl-CoA-carboxylase] ligase [Clostridia bacterium]
MSTKHDVLDILKKNTDREMSGQQIADILGLSRAAVWKAVKALRSEGFEIEAATKRGYVLKGGADELSSQNVRSFLPDKYKDISLNVLKSVDSTNTRLKEMAASGAPSESVLIAQTQTAGRGRQGRSFYSPPNTGLYMSILLRPKGSFNDAQLATIRAAVAVRRALFNTVGIESEIKWVNDVYYKNKKVCGILTEAAMDFESQGVDYLVTGIGINCTTKEEQFPYDVRSVAGSIELKNATRAELAACVIKEFLDLQSVPSGELINEYRSCSMMMGKRISFERAGRTYIATAVDINDSGNLVVRFPEGEKETLYSGEVHILKGFISD